MKTKNDDTPPSGHGGPSLSPVSEKRHPSLSAWLAFIIPCATAWRCWRTLILAVLLVATTVLMASLVPTFLKVAPDLLPFA